MNLLRWSLVVALLGCSSTTGNTTGDASADTATDVVTDAAGDVVSDAPACPLPPIDTSACTVDGDCASVARGCYCGQQPVFGVSRTYLAAVARCEDEARMHCALGCAVMDGQIAQDGRSVTDGGTIAARCERSDASSVGSCRTYVP